jgi:hypothetical protein
MASILPSWIEKLVTVETVSGDSFLCQLIDSNEGGCVVMREVLEGESSDAVARQFFYPWTSVHGIKLLEEPED